MLKGNVIVWWKLQMEQVTDEILRNRYLTS